MKATEAAFVLDCFNLRNTMGRGGESRQSGRNQNLTRDFLQDRRRFRKWCGGVAREMNMAVRQQLLSGSIGHMSHETGRAAVKAPG